MSAITPFNTPDDGDVSILAGGVILSGWQSVRVTRGIERCPSDFDLAVTEKYPGQASAIVLKPGQACAVAIGGDAVITGYIDRYAVEIGPGQHEIRIQGRGKCQDLVDCSADFNSYQIVNVTVAGLARQLAKPFGIAVSALAGEGPVLTQFNVIVTETPYEIINRVARYAGFLVYEDAAGNLVLAQAGKTAMASGFDLPGNIEAISAQFAADQLFSSYTAKYMTTDQYEDPSANNIPGGTVTDPNIRYRPHIIISEQGMNSEAVAIARAKWELARRIGHAQQVRVTCDSWRDTAGMLWTPNTLAPVSAPAAKVTPAEPWLITEVSYIRDERGTHAELMLMPPSAMTPEPVLLYQADSQIAQAIAPGGGGAALANPGGGQSGSGQVIAEP